MWLTALPRHRQRRDFDNWLLLILSKSNMISPTFSSLPVIHTAFKIKLFCIKRRTAAHRSLLLSETFATFSGRPSFGFSGIKAAYRC